MAKEDAQSMSTRQRSIAVSEFFAKNRHLLGFDNPTKSLLTAVREAVDNALDACEEAHILPEIYVFVEELTKTRFRVTIRDNGPGILKAQLPKIFAQLLYGSKFHRLKQSRGQQGIGISAAVMYAQMTTGKPAVVTSKTGKGRQINRIHLQIDTQKNKPKVVHEEILENNVFWDSVTSGTSISLILEGNYKGGKHGVDAYLRQTALSNPHATIFLRNPKAEVFHYPRVVNELPVDAKEIKPHPHGIELGTLIQMLQEAKKSNLTDFLADSFSRVSQVVSKDMILEAKLRPKANASRLSYEDSEALYKSIQAKALKAPPTDCLSPIGEEAIIKGLYWLFFEAQTEEKRLKNLKDSAEKATLDAELTALGNIQNVHFDTKKADNVEKDATAEKVAILKSAVPEKVVAAEPQMSFLLDFDKLNTDAVGVGVEEIPDDPIVADTQETALIQDDKTGENVTSADFDLTEMRVDSSDSATNLSEISLGIDGELFSEKEDFFVTAVTRKPTVYRGNPFQVEVGLFYGKGLPADTPASVFRFANRVPLQYLANACAMTKSVTSAPWKSYGLQQSRGAIPAGPVVIMVHIASAWVPYTSESKEAIAQYDEILKELRLAIMECGRKLQRFLKRRRKEADEANKRKYIIKYLNPIGEALKDILSLDEDAKLETIVSLKSILEETRADKI